ncbi:LytR cell envelope-related transcriptional attenuator [Haloactinopolyspora alba]|uniref:LytR cell envelope-related transcriptional attenuator n=1 Tax=Haloactinopolyspora alba TaxID=648780 RepID=A0A2P8DZ78_9ACTN|nr:LytR C-terminal domain-containing protein [Haloactinopolyspora alba]PSL02524.1 LytR cell envelope-related transcriptional attenuator [Haloactinopolyspora alba]
MGERVQRLWPSLVALLGTVAVVLGLLWVFDGDVTDSTPDDVAADGGGGPAEGGDAGGEAGTSTPSPSDGASAGADGSTGGPGGGEPTEPVDSPSTAPEELREPVGIANQTDVEGLEEYARDRLQDGGWEVPAVSGFEGNVPETTVYYPEGQEEAAEALSAQFPEVGRIRPTFDGVNQTRLVIVLVDDYVDEVGEPE